MTVTKGALLRGIFALLLSIPLCASAQWEKKPSSDWTEKEVRKLLNDSPWARTQVFTSPVTLFRQPTSGSQGVSGNNTARPPDATHVNFRVRFLSAKPVREAVTRMIELQQKKKPMDDETAARLKAFSSGEFHEYIVVTVTCDSQDPGANFQQAASLLRTHGTADLKNNTFLEIKGGKRLFLQEFQPPHPDGLGARFIFPRLVGGEPFITESSDEIRFFSELSPDYRLDRRFKIKNMTYGGQLEY
jgi:hypothetical protein